LIKKTKGYFDVFVRKNFFKVVTRGHKFLKIYLPIAV
jgi:hypothetical protein